MNFFIKDFFIFFVQCYGLQPLIIFATSYIIDVWQYPNTSAFFRHGFLPKMAYLNTNDSLLKLYLDKYSTRRNLVNKPPLRNSAKFALFIWLQVM